MAGAARGAAADSAAGAQEDMATLAAKEAAREVKEDLEGMVEPPAGE